MASNVHNLKSVLRAHNSPVNGVTSMDPCIDDAIELLTQSHGVLIVAAEAAEASELNEKITAAALRGAQTLLEIGLRNLGVGYETLIQRQRRAG